MYVQTRKAIHIVINAQKDGRPQITLERKIPLVTIKSIGISNLRDDWMVRNMLIPPHVTYLHHD
jgi:myosin-1